jgi:hypothetical protein
LPQTRRAKVHEFAYVQSARPTDSIHACGDPALLGDYSRDREADVTTAWKAVPFKHDSTPGLEDQFHRQLHLPGRIGRVWFHEIIRQFVVAGIKGDSGCHGVLHKRAGIHD